MKNNKGITLIALVITIIVMLILVAVTIRMAVNGGLFDYAGKAVGETNNALEAEQQLGNGGVTVDGTHYDSIDKYLNREPSITLISFTVDGTTCFAPVGALWEEWYATSYNTVGIVMARSGAMMSSPGSRKLVNSSLERVYGSNPIIDGETYNFSD